MDRRTEYDFIRVLGISYIIFIHHMSDYVDSVFATSFDKFLMYLFLGGFMFISGFILSEKYGSFGSLKDVKSFLKKRFLSIYPLYAVALLLFFLVMGISFHTMVLGMTLASPFSGERILTLWFVNVICLFYLFFVALVWRYSLRRFLTASLGISAGLLLLRFFSPSLFDFRMAIYFPVFAYGVLAAKSRAFSYLKRREVLGVQLFLAGLCFLAFLEQGGINTMIGQGFLVTFLLLSMCPLMQFGNFIVSEVELSYFIQRLAYVSFAMYLFHRIVFESLLVLYAPEPLFLRMAYLYFLGIPGVYLFAIGAQRGCDFLVKRMGGAPAMSFQNVGS